MQEIQERFTDFNLRPELLRALERKGFEHPMPVQTAVLRDESLAGDDLIVQARTGSGKTLAFALPLLNESLRSRRRANSPGSARTWASASRRSSAASTWSGRYARCATALPWSSARRGESSTTCAAARSRPTTSRAWCSTRATTCSTWASTTRWRRYFRRWTTSSARGSSPREVLSLTKLYLDAPKKISLVSDVASHSDITQKAYIIPSRKRFEGLVNVLIWENPSKSLLFCGTRAETQDIADRLCDIGFRATAIHGDMSQRERNNALSALRGGRVSILVATDVAARGLDIDAVSHVIQYGLPQNLEAFVHRSGRTGRAGHEGSNLILLTAREARQFKFMLHQSHSKLTLEWIPAPDAAEIEGQSRIRFENNIIEHALESDEFEEWARELLSREEAPVLVSGLLAKAYGDQPSGYSIREDVQFEMDREKGRRDAAQRGNGKDAARKERFKRPEMTGGLSVQFAAGRNDGWEVGPLLGAICRGAGLGREDVGNIRLRDTSAVVEISPRGASYIEARRERLEKEGLPIAAMREIKGDGERPRRTGDRAPRRENREAREPREGRESFRPRRTRDGESGGRRKFPKYKDE